LALRHDRGFEVLSQTSVSETQAIVDALYRGSRLSLPPGLRPKSGVPTAVVIFDQQPTRGATQIMGSERQPLEWTNHFTNIIKRTLPDREIFCVNLWQRSFRYTSVFRFDIWTLLSLRRPTVAPWVPDALYGPFGLYREGIEYSPGDATTHFRPMVWCSADEQQAILQAVANEGGRTQEKEKARRHRARFPRSTACSSRRLTSFGIVPGPIQKVCVAGSPRSPCLRAGRCRRRTDAGQTASGNSRPDAPRNPRRQNFFVSASDSAMRRLPTR